jgi:hypothetical protein
VPRCGLFASMGEPFIGISFFNFYRKIDILNLLHLKRIIEKQKLKGCARLAENPFLFLPLKNKKDLPLPAGRL